MWIYQKLQKSATLLLQIVLHNSSGYFCMLEFFYSLFFCSFVSFVNFFLLKRIAPRNCLLYLTELYSTTEPCFQHRSGPVLHVSACLLALPIFFPVSQFELFIGYYFSLHYRSYFFLFLKKLTWGNFCRSTSDFHLKSKKIRIRMYRNDFGTG